ncbi:MAG: hypothetical protein RMK50_02695 [Nitrososphaerota archaeon]|nr:hypothetical protein [Candidatus Bathyarchaeota archaeon]MDW8193718.1 hypothetical protein [Nitrososphaerota archaeon]
MQSGKRLTSIGREKLQQIIELCRSVEERSVDPFTVDVDDIIRVIREYFPLWDKPEDLCLDAEAIHSVASVVRLQSEWVKRRSTSLCADPFLIEEKVRSMGKEDVLNVFLKAWHPIVELEQLSLHSLSEAIEYWKSLRPLKDRWMEFPMPELEVEPATREELISQRILRDKAFAEELESFWGQLKEKVKAGGADGKIGYWNFICAETYEETVHRAFLASFLVTYGYATLEIHPLEGEIYIKPFERQVKPSTGRQLVSIPILISKEEWEKRRRGA